MKNMDVKNTEASQPGTGNGTNRPTRKEFLQQQAQEGNFAEIFRALSEEPPQQQDVSMSMHYLREAIHVASRGEPEGFSKALFQQMAAFNAFVLLRLQLPCVRALKEAFDVQAGALRNLSENSFFCQYMEMQKHSADLLQAWAATARSWQLARKHELRSGGLTNGYHGGGFNGQGKRFQGL